MSAASDQVLAALLAAPQHVNPAVALWLEIQNDGPISAEDLLAATGRIEDAIRQGENEAKQVEAALRQLRKAQPQPSRAVPVGF